MGFHITIGNSDLSRRLGKICEDKSKNVITLKQELFRWYKQSDNHKITIWGALQVHIILCFCVSGDVFQCSILIWAEGLDRNNFYQVCRWYKNGTRGSSQHTGGWEAFYPEHPCENEVFAWKFAGLGLWTADQGIYLWGFSQMPETCNNSGHVSRTVFGTNVLVLNAQSYFFYLL